MLRPPPLSTQSLRPSIAPQWPNEEYASKQVVGMRFLAAVLIAACSAEIKVGDTLPSVTLDFGKLRPAL